MVKSEEIIINNIGKKNIYYCIICKTAFLKFKNAESCEKSHARARAKNPKINKNEHYSRAINEKLNCDSSILYMLEYHVLVREAYGGKNHEFDIKALNIKEAADMVKSMYPNHSGYTIKKHLSCAR